MAESTDTARRARILEAATSVFLRYGLRKTSMDDLARAAGLSRQALYLHFATKEELFREAVLKLLGSLRETWRAALNDDGRPADERILAAFDAAHAHLVGSESATHMSELLAAATEHVGSAVAELDADLIADVAKLLKAEGLAASWKDDGVSARALAELLSAASYGYKHRAATRAEYRERMRIAVRIVCRGALR